MGHGVGHIGRVPVDDCRDDEVQSRGAVLLSLVAAIDDPALPERADCVGERMTLFALVEPSLAASAKRRIFQPVEHEQSALDLADFLKGDIHLVLPFIGGEFPQHH